MLIDFSLYLNPKDGWEKISQKTYTIKEVFVKVVVIFALIPPIGHLIGFTILKDFYIKAIKDFIQQWEGKQEQAQTVEYMKALLKMLSDSDMTKEFMIAATTYGFELLKPFVLAGLIFFLAGAFGGEKNPDKAFTVAVYSLVPTWIAGIFYMINHPITMIVLFLANFYTFYLVFTAGEKVLKIPTEGSKHFQFIIVLIILYLILSGLIGYIESTISLNILMS